MLPSLDKPLLSDQDQQDQQRTQQSTFVTVSTRTQNLQEQIHQDQNAPKTVNRQDVQNDPKTVNRQGQWGGRKSGYAHDVCECCCGKFNCSTCLCSAFCPCYVFYRTAQELNARRSQMASEPSCFITDAGFTAGLLTSAWLTATIAGYVVGAVPAVTGATVEGIRVGTLCNILELIGSFIIDGFTCHFGQELGKITPISEDCCTQCLCCFFCTWCRMTQIYHTLTDDDVGCICCCSPPKSTNDME